MQFNIQVRKALKGALPSPLFKFLAAKRVAARERRLAILSPAEAFNEIYRKGYWKQGATLSGPGSEGRWATQYVDFMRRFIAYNNIESVVDAGCGDFSIGSQLAPLVTKYVGLDIAQLIVDRNKNLFKNQNVFFECLDLTCDKLPPADLLIVRQVFQHLPNKMIELALSNIERSSFKHVLVIEECIDRIWMNIPNLDLKSYTVSTRVELASGVDLSAAPFCRSMTELERFIAEGKLTNPKAVLTISSLSTPSTTRIQSRC